MHPTKDIIYQRCTIGAAHQNYRRATGLTADFCATARKVDWMYCGTPRPAPAQSGTLHPPCQVGPVETRLNSFGRIRGWVFGAWGECSEEVHSMVQRLAVANVRRAATQPQMTSVTGLPENMHDPGTSETSACGSATQAAGQFDDGS